MKDKMKGYIAGVLSCILIMGSLAYAQGVKQTIEVWFGNVNMTVNGETVDVDTILYNGTTYAPVRKVADMLGKKVGWNGEANTVSINDKDYIEVETLNDKIVNFYDCIIDIGGKYYFGFPPRNIKIDSKSNIYTDDRYSLLGLLNIFRGDFEIVSHENPNIDGSLKHNTNPDLQEYKNELVYEGLDTIEMYHYKLYNNDKSRFVEIIYRNKRLYKVLASDNETDMMVSINDSKYIDIRKALNYLGCDYEIYGVEDKDSYAIKFFEYND